VPLDLAALTDPGHTVLLTIEIQEDVVGDESMLPDLAAAARPMIENAGALVRAAHSAGVVVVHSPAENRPDRLGESHNARLFVAVAKRRPPGPAGPAPSAVLHPGLGAEPGDLVLPRRQGVSALHDTGIDSALRNLGATTLVVTGVSVNVAVLSTVFDAVNRGFQVIVPRDAVAGVGGDYVDAVLDNTIGLLATITTTASLVSLWASSAD
jgi:nicotinamidase-related amidase